MWHDARLDPTFPCRDAVALLASHRFAEMLAAAIPDDWLCRRLVEITRAALDRHYGLSPAFHPEIGSLPSSNREDDRSPGREREFSMR